MSSLRFGSRCLRSASNLECRASILDQICAREMDASQYRLMPQQRPDTSSFKSGFESLVSIQRRSPSGTLLDPSFLGIDMDSRDCVSGFVS